MTWKQAWRRTLTPEQRNAYDELHNRVYAEYLSGIGARSNPTPEEIEAALRLVGWTEPPSPPPIATDPRESQDTWKQYRITGATGDLYTGLIGRRWQEALWFSDLEYQGANYKESNGAEIEVVSELETIHATFKISKPTSHPTTPALSEMTLSTTWEFPKLPFTARSSRFSRWTNRFKSGITKRIRSHATWNRPRIDFVRQHNDRRTGNDTLILPFQHGLTDLPRPTGKRKIRESAPIMVDAIIAPMGSGIVCQTSRQNARNVIKNPRPTQDETPEYFSLCSSVIENIIPAYRPDGRVCYVLAHHTTPYYYYSTRTRSEQDLINLSSDYRRPNPPLSGFQTLIDRMFPHCPTCRENRTLRGIECPTCFRRSNPRTPPSMLSPVLHDYSYRPNAPFKARPQSKKPRFMGFELEVSAPNDQSRDQIVETVVDLFPGFLYSKSDSSIPRYGAEIVSSPFEFAWLMDQRANLKTLLQTIRDQGGRCFYYASSGFHVHLDRQTLSPLQILKLWTLLSTDPTWTFKLSTRKSRGELDHWAMVGSANDRTEKRKAIVAAKKKDGDPYSWQRYTALNLCPRHTVELRLFKGNLKPTSFLRTLEYARSMGDFVREASLRETTPAHFLKYLRETREIYPNAFRHCAAITV